MIIFHCHVCRTSLSAEASQAGQVQRCPTCRETVRVPMPKTAASAKVPARGAAAAANTLRPGAQFMGRRYGFSCAYCSSRLEANESMAGQDGQCPTCGNQITIPILDRYDRLIDPRTKEIIKQDPHPVHAYAAAGARAPKIVRGEDRKQRICCARCGVNNPITANLCQGCGIPFTMEGATGVIQTRSNSLCASSLVVSLASLPLCFIVVPALIGICLGVAGLMQVNRESQPARSSQAQAIFGIVIGVVSLIIGVMHLM